MPINLRPRPADVARWVASLATRLPRYASVELDESLAAQRLARAQLKRWGLGEDGKPLPIVAP